MFDGLEYGLNFSVFRSKVTSRKLTTFLFASMVIFRLHFRNILQISFFILSVALGVCWRTASPYRVVSVKADFTDSGYFVQLGKQVTTDQFAGLRYTYVYMSFEKLTGIHFFQNGSLSISQRRGIITLIPKADGDLKELSNWRPISSLLNIDYKILTKALAKRIEKYLPKLINSDQTGFVKGRYIGQNIRLLNDIMEYLDAKKTSGLLLFIDFEKAFDSLEWDFRNKALNVFNFGPNVKRWITTFYKGVQSAVMNGGFLTTYFSISRRVRQGCPLSPLLFILATELLAAKIRQDSNCKGISRVM